MSGNFNPLKLGRLGIAFTAIIAVVAISVCSYVFSQAEESNPVFDHPIHLSADWCQEWRDGASTVAIFRGACRVTQGQKTYSANNMVVWVHDREPSSEEPEHLTVYLEDAVEISDEHSSRTEQSIWADLQSASGIRLSVRGRVTDRAGSDDPLFKRAVHRQSGSERGMLRQTQLTVPVQTSMNPPIRTVQFQQSTGLRRIRVSPRSIAMPYNVQSFLSNNTTPPEQVTILTGGINVLVEGAFPGGDERIGAVDLSADRVVIWTEASQDGQFPPDSLQRSETPYQVYLEGNIVIRQQSQIDLLGGKEVSNVIRATRAYYDARDNRALILDAELNSYLPEMDAGVRLRAERLRQNSLQSYHAQNAWFTTSQYGKPGYRVQASDIFVEPRQKISGPPQIDPRTGQPTADTSFWITALNSQFLVEDVPLFYIPQLSVPAEDPGIPLQGVGLGYDKVFGAQIQTRWDLMQILGIREYESLDGQWSLLADYLSKRGPALGTEYNYNGMDPWGNTFLGAGQSYSVYDQGTDNLGSDRRSLIPKEEFRGITRWQHRHLIAPFGMTLDAELSGATDRNVMESYREQDFDTGKDLEVLAYLRQQFDENWMWSVMGRPTINYFENNTAWLPRADLYSLGEPILGGPITWTSHSSVGYAQLNQATPPTDPSDTFTPLPYYIDANGLVAMTRHEVQLPFNLGPIKVAPYALGEAAFWSDSFSGDSIDRLYGRGGIRASLQFWKVFPQVQSDIFNLNGLVHKATLEADYGYAGSTRNLSEIPQWNEFDDNAQERFRERFITNTFGGVLPDQFDPRFFALRYGAGSSVTDPYHELVDDQQVLRMGLRQRLQTKVGPPDRQRIKDWMTLDLGASYFPNADRDNFGEDFGLFTTRYVWNVGDRTSIIASSLVDFFNDAPHLWSVGVQNQRGLRGSLYVGLRNIRGGPIDSKIVTATYSYVLSPKWVSTMSSAYDFGEGRNRGQSLTMTRVGEWLLFHAGANYDVSKDNVGFMFSVEPRLSGRRGTLSSTQLSSLLNTQ